MASKVSNDDWPALDKLSEVLKPMWSSTVLGKTTDLIGAGLKGFAEGFGPGRPEDTWFEPSNADLEFQKNWPTLYANLKNTVAMLGIPMNVVNRTFIGALGGSRWSCFPEGAKQVGLDEQSAERIKRDAMGMLESYMFTGPHGAAPDAAAIAKAAEMIKVAEPYIKRRRAPSSRPTPRDQQALYAEEAKADAKNLDDAPG